MKTKNIIKELQKIDPSGETHARFQGGEELIGFERKEGYYDGAYVYKNENDKLVITDKGEKIDAHFEGIEDRIWECEGDLEKIKKEIIIDFSKKEAREDYLERVIKPEAKKAREWHQKSLTEFTSKVLKKVKKGWTITQPLNTEIGHLNHMYFERKGKKEKMCQGECHAVLNSGFFQLRTEKTQHVWTCKIKEYYMKISRNLIWIVLIISIAIVAVVHKLTKPNFSDPLAQRIYAITSENDYNVSEIKIFLQLLQKGQEIDTLNNKK